MLLMATGYRHFLTIPSNQKQDIPGVHERHWVAGDAENNMVREK